MLRETIKAFPFSATTGGSGQKAAPVALTRAPICAEGKSRQANPWDAPSLEWATQSPPAACNFAHIPVATGRTPLWANRGALPVVTGLRVDERELLLTRVLDAEPDLREPSPRPSIWPLVAAIVTGLTFIGSMFTPWAVVIGGAPIACGAPRFALERDRHQVIAIGDRRERFVFKCIQRHGRPGGSFGSRSAIA